jgi:hypothetical protein
MFDAKRWRDRAEEARARAEQMRDPVVRQTLLKMAEEYEKLAARAERHPNSEHS